MQIVLDWNIDSVYSHEFMTLALRDMLQFLPGLLYDINILENENFLVFDSFHVYVYPCVKIV